MPFIRALKRHFRGRRIILLWDGLGAHTSRRMRAYVAGQHAWLSIERLPAYAPDLNPVEPLWGNVKTRDSRITARPTWMPSADPLRAGLGRVRRHPTLALSFLRHAGLTL